MKFFRVLIFSLVAFGVYPGNIYAENLRVSLQIQPGQREKFENIFHLFYQETGIKVTSIVETDLDYKTMMPVWLLEGKDTPDVLYWCSSQRLYFYAEKDLILPITDLWDEQEWDEYFSHLKRGVTYEANVYAVPFAYYHWGLFYRKSVLAELGGVPTDWTSFLDMLKKMKAADITPIGLGAEDHWPALGWFDYINLRMNGLDFHLNLLNGGVSFHDPRAQNVFVELKKLVDQGFFNENLDELKWEEILPLFYRKKIGFMLLGNFVESKWPKTHSVMDDIGFMPFPKIKEDVPRYENAPTDVFLIPRNTKNIENAKAFLRFITQPRVQSILNEDLGYLPPNKKSAIAEDPFIQAGHRLLTEAEGITQYFDRDTHPDFDKLTTGLITAFLSTGNIEELTEKLEIARMKVFGPVKDQEIVDTKYFSLAREPLILGD